MMTITSEIKRIAQTTVLNYLIAHPTITKSFEIKTEWFDDIKEKILVDVLLESNGEPMENDEIIRQLKEKDSNELYSMAALSFAKNTGERELTRTDFEKRLMTIEKDYKQRRFEIAVDDLSRANMDGLPKELIDRKQNTLKDRMRELEQVGQLGNDGKLDDAIDRMKYKFKNDVPTGIKTYPNLDIILGGGIQKGEFILIGALTGVGKTAFAMSAALEMLERNADMNVDFFSLEMTQDQMLEKLISAKAQIANQAFRNPNRRLNKEQKEKASIALDAFKDGRFRVFDGDRNIDAIARTITRRAYECKEGNYIAIVDYIGLANSSTKSKQQTAVVEEMSRTLKSLTITSNIPIIALSQFSRNITNRDNKKPQLSDLKDSSSLEQDANIVIFLWNPDIELNGDEYRNRELITECVIAKSRSGMTGDIHFRFLKTKSTFVPENYSSEDLKEMGL